MKKGIVVLMILLLCSCKVQGKELITEEDFDFKESTRLLEDSGYKDIPLEEWMESLLKGQIVEVLKDMGMVLKSRTIDDFFEVRKLMLNLLLILILSALFSNFVNVFENHGVSDTAFYICYISVAAVIATMFDRVCLMASDFFHLMIGYFSTMIPTYFATVSITGQASAMGFYQMILVVMGIMQYLFFKVFLPLIKIYLAVGLVNNIFEEDLLSKMCLFLKKMIVKGNRFLVGTVTGLHVLEGMILPALDGSKNALVYKVANTIPGVGNGLESYTGILFGSVNLIKNTFGGIIVVVIIIICGVPYIKMQLYHFMMQFLIAAIQPVADQRMTNGIQVACDSIGMLAGVIAAVALLFIVSIVIIGISTGMIR